MEILDTTDLLAEYTICDAKSIKNETTKSVFVDFGDCEHWIPKSLCKYGKDLETGGLIVAVKDWKYKELGL